jgi:hypothetical protein
MKAASETSKHDTSTPPQESSEIEDDALIDLEQPEIQITVRATVRHTPLMSRNTNCEIALRKLRRQCQCRIVCLGLLGRYQRGSKGFKLQRAGSYSESIERLRWCKSETALMLVCYAGVNLQLLFAIVRKFYMAIHDCYGNLHSRAVFSRPQILVDWTSSSALDKRLITIGSNPSAVYILITKLTIH